VVDYIFFHVEFSIIDIVSGRLALTIGLLDAFGIDGMIADFNDRMVASRRTGAEPPWRIGVKCRGGRGRRNRP
jgi:hypothetical protein